MLGLKIRDLRQERDMSQAELAAAAGVHQTMISALERGTTTATWPVVVRIADALGVSTDSLRLNGHSEPEQATTPA